MPNSKWKGHHQATIRRCLVWSDTKEMMHTRLGPDVGGCAGFKSSKTDPDLWMRDADDHYTCVANYIDDILIKPKDPKAILDLLQKPKGPYKFKGVGSPEYYLGEDVKITYSGDSNVELGLSSKTYMK
eukprot:2196523-Ditylum_brightwellii.AAC.1